MATETQTDFSGGLNTRLPAHMIGANQATELQNVDLSFGDLRGEYGVSSGGEQEFFYEAGESWVSPTGFSGAALIIDWPYGLTYSGSNSVTLASSINYFSGSPNALIKDGVTITINEGVSVVIYERTQGVHGANSYVEYNDDLYISRGTFDITGEVVAGALTVVETGTDTYKLQIGDELAHSNITAGTFITEINTADNEVTLSTAASGAIYDGSAGTPDDITVKAIVSKYIDGTITTSYRAGVNIPAPIWAFTQVGAYNVLTDRGGSHSETWYNASDPIPFQYGLAAYDSTGVESTMSELSDSNLGVIGGVNFPVVTASLDHPQHLRVASVLRDTATKTNRGRYALYRVGGSSAIIKRLDNLYFDEHMTVVTAEGDPTTTNLVITLDDAEPTFQFKVKWYAFKDPGNTTAAYRYYNATSGYVNPYDASPGASLIRSAIGETEFLSPSSGGDLVITLDGSSAAHHVDLFVVMKIPGETIEREYVARAMTHIDGTAVANDATYDYIDFQKAGVLVDIQPIEEDTTPTKNIEGLVESSNLFYAFLGNRLHISDYGNPNSWPASGFIDFDQDITGLGTLGSELVVFTEYGMYRVFGSDPSLLKKVEIQTTEGIKAGAGKTVTRFQSGLLFAGHNGICFYNGQSVQRMTQNSLNTFALPNSTATNNTGGYFEDTFFLLGTSGTGYKMDMKRNAMLSRTTMNAKTLFFRGSDNTLYADTGKVAYPTGDRQNFSVTTRQFVGGDVNVEKVFNSVSLSGSSFSGTVNILVDGSQTDTFSISPAVTDLDRTLYLAAPRQGNGIQVQLSNCTGQVNKISVTYNGAGGLVESLFNSVSLKYTGTPTVTVDLDGTNKVSSTTLSAPTGVIGIGKLYFAAMSTGIIPHLRETNNEASGRVLEYSYDATPV